jgi:hypothetical protein
MIANLAQVSLTLVNRKLAQGKTPRTILEEAIDHQRQTLPDLPVTPLPVTNGHAAANGALSYSAAQAQKESWLAALRQLEYQQKAGALIPVEYVRIWGVRFLVEGRDILQNGPSQLADTLAAESDPRVVEQTLRAWVDRCLERFFQVETLWGEPSGETETGLRERFDAAKLAVVKRPGNGGA